MKNIFFAATMALGFASCSQTNTGNSAEGGVADHVNVATFAQFEQNADAQLLDVRTAQEYAEGHIEGSVNIDIFSADFDQQVQQLDKSKPVYVYCRSGRRSANAMARMKDAGFTEIHNLQGGIMAWQQAGKAVQ